jgi:hypothetical protein
MTCMNDSNFREVPDDTGYTRAFILSIGIHGLLACAFWIGAGLHSSTEDTGTTMKEARVQLHAIPTPTHTSSSRPSQLANQTSTAPPKPPSVNARKLADASSNKPRLKKNAPGKTANKVRLASAKGSTKDKHTANARKAPAKQNTNTHDVAEIRKLENMREAELRRISKNLS